LANFIAYSNSFGQQAIDLVGSGDTKAIATLIDGLKAFEKYVTDFGAAQGGNELPGALGAEIAAMIKGLQTGDATLVTAAADQMHGNAADAGDHNVPATGGTYNTEGVTVAGVLGTPVPETPPAATVAAADPAAPHAVAPTANVSDVPGMLEADTSGQQRVRRSGSRNGRREEAFAGLCPQGTIVRRWPQ
jgi:hypothetical protein